MQPVQTCRWHEFDSRASFEQAARDFILGISDCGAGTVPHRAGRRQYSSQHLSQAV